MKRQLSMALALIVLLLAFAAVLPVSAATDSDWKKLTYTLDPLTEGEEPVTADVIAKDSIPRSCSLHFDADKAELSVNGKAAEPGVRLEQAGIYSISIVNKSKTTQKLTYDITVLPDINLYPGQIFTEYPTITWTNAAKVEHQRDLHLAEVISSGTQLRELGRHTVTAYGYEKGTQHLVKFVYVISVKAVNSVRVFDEASGKEALNVIVGSFDDKTVSAKLDGERELVTGSNIVTGVGTHTLAVLVNGQPLEQPLALPDSNDLSLRIELYLDADAFESQAIQGKKDLYNAFLEWNEPYYFDFSRWDAEIFLDGTPVSGEVRVGEHGDHVLTVRDAQGNTVDGAFSVYVGNAPAAISVTELNLTFKNPHLIYFIIAVIPSAVLLVAAFYFFVARRRIV